MITEKNLKLLNATSVEELSENLPDSWGWVQRYYKTNNTAPLFLFLKDNIGKDFSEKAYRLVNGSTFCYCGNRTNFHNWKKGYTKYCSTKCMYADPVLNAETLIKRQTTMLERYGAKTTLESKELSKKVEQTKIEKYGENWQEIQTEKIIKTNIERFGGRSPNKDPEIAKKQGITRKKNTLDKHIVSANKNGYTLISGEPFSSEGALWSCDKGHEFNESWLTKQRIPICRVCYPMLGGTSFLEQEVQEFLGTLTRITENYRLYLTEKKYFELDAYLPKYNLGIEFNGLYWHSEAVLQDNNYHLTKTLAFQENGINVIHIFEHEWKFKRSICESIIKAKMGIFDKKYFARKLQIKEIDKETAKAFFEDNHLNGYAESTHNYALCNGDEIIQVASFRKDRYGKDKSIYELIRFSSTLNTLVVGGLGRLSKHAFKTLGNLKTFCDRKISVGNAYTKANWQLVSTTTPGYWYFDRQLNVSHRSRFQKKKLLELTNGDSSCTEYELAKSLKLERFWDCGNFIFEYKG